MKNIKSGLFFLITLTFLFGSCIEHEVVPAPVQMVDLSCHFTGVINGTSLEFTENVNTYTGKATKNLSILPAPEISSASYNFEMSSVSSLKSIKIILGSVLWDASVSESPSLTTFNAFHATTTIPNFSPLGTSGFEVSYRDDDGVVWTSKQNGASPQNVTFTGIGQESDTLGDYSKFTCMFNCYVYHLDTASLQWDSLKINNGILKGWFAR
jgi:hypothetical protein